MSIPDSRTSSMRTVTGTLTPCARHGCNEMELIAFGKAHHADARLDSCRSGHLSGGIP